MRALSIITSLFGVALLASSLSAATIAESAPVPVTSTNTVFETIEVRNPFWPIGYNGKREIISPDKIVSSGLLQSPDEEVENQDEGKPNDDDGFDWSGARETLKFGAVIRGTNEEGKPVSTIVINDYPYADGDLISVNFDGNRYTWQVQGLSDDGVLRLKRLRARIIEVKE